MSIYINGVILANQPTVLVESLIQLQTDQEAILGNMTRNRLGQKKQSDMTFAILQPSDYQTLIANFTTGSGVVYLNDQSDYSGGIMTFNGLPTFQESAYVQGSSLYRPFQVTIREI
jgi:hypothetical protein